MKYMGSKSRIKKEIVTKIDPIFPLENFVEWKYFPFWEQFLRLLSGSSYHFGNNIHQLLENDNVY